MKGLTATKALKLKHLCRSGRPQRTDRKAFAQAQVLQDHLVTPCTVYPNKGLGCRTSKGQLWELLCVLAARASELTSTQQVPGKPIASKTCLSTPNSWALPGDRMDLADTRQVSACSHEKTKRALSQKGKARASQVTETQGLHLFYCHRSAHDSFPFVRKRTV